MPKRKNRKTKLGRADLLAMQLPDELRTFDGWLYSDGQATGLQDYLRAMSEFVAESPVGATEVMNAAGLSVADWYAAMLTRGTHVTP